MAIPQVNYCWTQMQASPSCQNHFICGVGHSTLYQNLVQKTQRMQVGNGQCVSILFIIPVIIDIHGYGFEI